MQRGRIIDAIAQITHGMPGLLQRAHDPLFLLRVGFDEQGGGSFLQAYVIKGGDLFAGQHRLAIQPDDLGQMCGDIAVVAADHLDGDAKSRQIADHFGGIRFGRVRKGQKAAKGHLCLVGTVIVRFGGHHAGGKAQHAQALFAFGLEKRLQLGAGCGIKRDVGIAFAQGGAAAHGCAHEHAIGAGGQRCVGGNLTGALFHRKGFAGHRRLGHQKIPSLQQATIGGNQVACRQDDHIARHQRGHRDRLFHAIAQHPRRHGQAAL